MARQISRPGGVSRTDRASGAGLDINQIVARAARGGPLSTGMQSGRQPFFADISSVDYQASLNASIRVQQSFDAFPSELRTRFANNPAGVLTFLENPANRPEAERLGLVRPKEPPQEPIEERIGKAVAKHTKSSKVPEGA